ncbi:MAG: ester cyclase [Solirubrobacterales bacterium]
MPLLGPSLRSRREEIVREHMDSENRHEFDGTLETFDHPRYEIVPTGEVHDGPEEVMAYFEETRRAFPDQRNELVELHHADDAVIAEFILRGTHEGPLRALPPTGRDFEVEMIAVFVFEQDRLVCERVYFDAGTILQQLGVARDPLSIGGRLGTAASHPLTIGRGLVRRVTGR